MKYIDDTTISSLLDYHELIPAIRDGFSGEITVPMRHHHDYENPSAGKDSTLLIMPAWKAGADLGIKTVTVSPENARHGLPAINGLYILFDAVKGLPIAVMDAKSLTRIRTAATSALASSYLSRKDARTMLMIGTGALAPELIRAHSAIRDFDRIYIWGRSEEKARSVAEMLPELDVEVIGELQEQMPQADLISIATLSPDPLVRGDLLKPGTHVDLVGAYRKDMREADDEVMKRSTLFVDSFQTAPVETGDLVIPLQEGTISMEDIKADLFDLCAERHTGRSSGDEITCFKSVGHALEDLVAARLVFDKVQNR